MRADLGALLRRVQYATSSLRGYRQLFRDLTELAATFTARHAATRELDAARADFRAAQSTLDDAHEVRQEARRPLDDIMDAIAALPHDQQDDAWNAAADRRAPLDAAVLEATASITSARETRDAAGKIQDRARYALARLAGPADAPPAPEVLHPEAATDANAGPAAPAPMPDDDDDDDDADMPDAVADAAHTSPAGEAGARRRAPDPAPDHQPRTAAGARTAADTGRHAIAEQEPAAAAATARAGDPAPAQQPPHEPVPAPSVPDPAADTPPASPAARHLSDLNAAAEQARRILTAPAFRRHHNASGNSGRKALRSARAELTAALGAGPPPPDAPPSDPALREADVPFTDIRLPPSFSYRNRLTAAIDAVLDAAHDGYAARAALNIDAERRSAGGGDKCPQEAAADSSDDPEVYDAASMRNLGGRHF